MGARMRRRAAASFVAAALALLLELFFRIKGCDRPSIQLGIALLAASLVYVGGVQLYKSSPDDGRIMKRTVGVIFALYLLLLLNFTLFDGNFGRIAAIDREPVGDYFARRGNLIPFHMIIREFKGFAKGTYHVKDLIINTAGNLAAFAPTALFLMLLSKKFEKFLPFFGVTSVLIIAVESAQLLLRVGSYDVDDYILNILGASILFLLLSTKPGRNLRQKIMHPSKKYKTDKEES